MYAGRDTVSQVGKIAPGEIKATTDNINVAEQRISQLISQKGEHILLKVLRGAIKDVDQTLFRLLENFGTNQFNKLKRKISKQHIMENNYIYNKSTNNYICF